MIPYIESHIYSFGPLTLQTWGTFVALGILIGFFVTKRRAKKLGLDVSIIGEAATWIVVSAMVFARLAHVFFYDAATYIADPIEVLRIWNGGMSVMGGFLG